MKVLCSMLMAAFAAGAQAAPLEVAALHPLLADLAKQVGGDKVAVHDLMGSGGDAHRFEPRPADLKRMQNAALILASGKNMEPYLGRLRDTLKEVPVVEVGRTIPSLQVGKDEVYTCCPQHGPGAIDPHWWHGIENMRRAARVVAKEFGAKDPANKDFYLNNATAYGQRLAALKQWAKTELAKVPRGQRKLVTAHNAFGYFANEFGFEVIAVAGLTAEQSITPQDLARTIESVQRAGVQAVFPEKSHNVKTVESLSKTTGVALAKPLISDGNGSGAYAGFEGMIRYNVGVIVEALGKH
jgi:zinc/manganese transport system substrate-binding protein